VTEHQPVLTALVNLPWWWGLVAGAVFEAEQLPVKLSESASVRGIQDDLQKGRERL
jgi:hypothetical protein